MQKEEKVDSKFRMRLAMMEIDKTPERREFESTHTCYVYGTREQNQYGYNIDSCYNGHRKDAHEVFSSNVGIMKMRARFNMGEVRAIWLPNEIENVDWNWLQDNKYLLDKYSFKL
jgi:hypothetical protein